MSHRQQLRTASALCTATGAAAASVIAARMLAFADPAAASSAWHRAESQRMAAEKVGAASDGMLAAGAELALLPMRLMHLAARPATWTPGGWADAWMDAAGLWLAVGNAALRPAKVTAVRNRARLARRTR